MPPVSQHHNVFLILLFILHHFAVGIFPLYFSNDNDDNPTIEGGAVEGTYDIFLN